MRTSIWWSRRDLRLTDNQALSAALSSAEQVIPVFIIDPALIKSPYVGEKRLIFLLEGLEALDQQLKTINSWLNIRHGKPIEELTKLIKETGAEAIYAEPDYSPYAAHRDDEISKRLPINWVGSPVLHPPGSILTNEGKPYQVYTPFRKKWKSLPFPDERSIIPYPKTIQTPADCDSLSLYEIRQRIGSPASRYSNNFEAGEGQARQKLTAFIEDNQNSISRYAEQRNRMDIPGTSKLSPYFRFGMLSARQAVIAAHQAIQTAPGAIARKGAETWLNELIWREFYVHILYYFPFVRKRNFRLEAIPWENDHEKFAAWGDGKTGYPIVDAAMRQLRQTGWMHNRARMIVGSFLTKDLHINWQWGERWFMQHLVDGDPAANNGGWQWVAGTGTDAAPYFRIFNPITQSEKFDPLGNYIRQWIPELGILPQRYIHAPWKMDKIEQQKLDLLIGRNYPQPIVDHQWARQRTLDLYQQARK